MTVKFNATKTEFELIKKIAARASVSYAKAGVDLDVGSLLMDLEATHSNGCPLDLVKFLAFPPFDFVHDISGITKHINRETGKLDGYFLPRCAKPEVEKFCTLPVPGRGGRGGA